MEFITNYNKEIKILSFCSVETGVLREKTLQAKLRVDYFSLSLFLDLHKTCELFD